MLAACSLATASHHRCEDCRPIRGQTYVCNFWIELPLVVAYCLAAARRDIWFILICECFHRCSFRWVNCNLLDRVQSLQAASWSLPPRHWSTTCDTLWTIQHQHLSRSTDVPNISAYNTRWLCLSCGCGQSMEWPSANDHGLTVAAEVPPTTVKNSFFKQHFPDVKLMTVLSELNCVVPLERSEMLSVTEISAYLIIII